MSMNDSLIPQSNTVARLLYILISSIAFVLLFSSPLPRLLQLATPTEGEPHPTPTVVSLTAQPLAPAVPCTPAAFASVANGGVGLTLRRAALFISGESRDWSRDASYAELQDANLLSPLVDAGFTVDLIMCLDESPAARGVAESIVTGHATSGAGNVFGRASSITALLFPAPEVPPTVPEWHQFTRIAQCRACVAPPNGSSPWQLYVVVRPDLFVQSILPDVLSQLMSKETVHARVRAAVNVAGLTGSHFSFNFERYWCWDHQLPRVSSETPPFIMPDDHLAVFSAGQAETAYFGAAEFWRSGGAPRLNGSKICGIPAELESEASKLYKETRLADALLCNGITVSPLKLNARLATHLYFGPCYSKTWADVPSCAAVAAGHKDCNASMQPVA